MRGGARSYQVQLDAATNRAARYLIGAASNKSVVLDFGVIIQAESAVELPEQILGAVRVHRLSGLASSESFMEKAGSGADDGDSEPDSRSRSKSKGRLWGKGRSVSEDDEDAADDDDGAEDL